MSKRNKLKKQVQQQEQKEQAAPKPMKVGNHTFPVFDGLAAAFGARINDYPPYREIPEEFRQHTNPYVRVMSSLFFRGGKLSDFGLSLKPGFDHGQAMTAIRALLCSFDPKHEHKEATVAWCLSEWCDGTPRVDR